MKLKRWTPERRAKQMATLAAKRGETAVQHKPKTLKDYAEVFYMKDTYASRYRVWRKDWPGDVFVCIPIEDFEAVLRIMQGFGTMFYDYTEDFYMEGQDTNHLV